MNTYILQANRTNPRRRPSETGPVFTPEHRSGRGSTEWPRAILGAFIALSLMACGGKRDDSERAGPDSSSHWLSRCQTDEECGDGLSCLCNRCTITCDDASECTSVSDAVSPVCEVVDGCNASSLCLAPCTGDECTDASPTATPASPDAGPTTVEPTTPTPSSPQPGPDASAPSPTPTSTPTPTPTSGPECTPRLSPPAPLDDPEPGGTYPTFTWSDAGVIGVSAAANRDGYRVIRLGDDGFDEGATLWTDVQPSEVKLAINASTLAIVEQANEASSGRAVCRLALATVDPIAPVMAPTRFSNTPTPDTVANEVLWCGVAPLGDGFLLVWQQFADSSGDLQQLLGQRIDAQGNEVGAPIVVAEGDKSIGPTAMASDGTQTLLALLSRGGDERSLTVIDESSERSVPIDARITASGAINAMSAAHGGFVVHSGEDLWLTDASGVVVAGPVPTARFVTSLEDGYVTVDKEEFLVARTLDASFAQSSEVTGVSVDRSASAVALIGSTDGDDVSLVYTEEGALQVASITCGDEITPLGPAACPLQDPLIPLDDGCTDDVCYVVLRLDGPTLGVKGWAATGAPLTPTDSEQARARAAAAFSMNSEYVTEPSELTGPDAGLYYAYASPSDFGAFALVGADTGLVVTAGDIVWSGSGNLWLPTAWNPAADVSCGNTTFDPETVHLGDTGCDQEGTTLPSAQDALNVALQTNLAANVASRGAFSAYSYLYTPSVGACSPQLTEYLVVLTNRTTR